VQVIGPECSRSEGSIAHLDSSELNFALSIAQLADIRIGLPDGLILICFLDVCYIITGCAVVLVFRI
jgi:hypothetical protein